MAGTVMCPPFIVRFFTSNTSAYEPPQNHRALRPWQSW